MNWILADATGKNLGAHAVRPRLEVQISEVTDCSVAKFKHSIPAMDSLTEYFLLECRPLLLATDAFVHHRLTP